jgi:hypothetical protein
MNEREPEVSKTKATLLLQTCGHQVGHTSTNLFERCRAASLARGGKRTIIEGLPPAVLYRAEETSLRCPRTAHSCTPRADICASYCPRFELQTQHLSRGRCDTGHNVRAHERKQLLCQSAGTVRSGEPSRNSRKPALTDKQCCLLRQPRAAYNLRTCALAQGRMSVAA